MRDFDIRRFQGTNLAGGLVLSVSIFEIGNFLGTHKMRTNNRLLSIKIADNLSVRLILKAIKSLIKVLVHFRRPKIRQF